VPLGLAAVGRVTLGAAILTVDTSGGKPPSVLDII
jgi:hypothetical protein